MLSLTSGKKITNEKVFKYQSAGDKTIEIVESAKLPQLAHHLRPIFGLVFFVLCQCPKLVLSKRIPIEQFYRLRVENVIFNAVNV